MRRVGLALSLLLLFVATVPSAEEPERESLQERLIGTWKLTTARYGGEPFAFPKGTTMVKHVTPTHFMWATYGADGVVTRAAGGPYAFQGDKYEESPAYGMSSDFDTIKGKPQSFTCVIEGDQWKHNGKLSNVLTIEEVWERVEPR